MFVTRVSGRAAAVAGGTPPSLRPLLGGGTMLLCFLFAAAACASGRRSQTAASAASPAPHATSRRVITREEIDAITASDAETVVRLLRPEWLLVEEMSQSAPRRGPDTLLPSRRADQARQLAYVYVTPRGECSPVPMPLARVTRMEYVRPGATSVVIGQFRASGAVLVFVDDTTSWRH